jgi:hypothetical protein
MTSISSKLAVVAACAGTAFMASVMNTSPALAFQFNFIQEGFSGGGTLTGSFSGEDLNNDNILSQGELTSFVLSLRGDTVTSFENLNVLQTLDFNRPGLPRSFNLTSPTGEDVAIQTRNPIPLPGGGELIIGREAGTPFLTTNLIVVRDGSTRNTTSYDELTLVPEPNSAIGLAGLALLGLGRFTQKKLSSQRTGV